MIVRPPLRVLVRLRDSEVVHLFGKLEPEPLAHTELVKKTNAGLRLTSSEFDCRTSVLMDQVPLQRLPRASSVYPVVALRIQERETWAAGDWAINAPIRHTRHA